MTPRCRFPATSTRAAAQRRCACGLRWRHKLGNDCPRNGRGSAVQVWQYPLRQRTGAAVQTGKLRASIGALIIVGMYLGLGACGGGGGNAPPSLGTSSFTTNENVALTAQLTSTDSNSVTYTKLSSPASGTLTSFT